MLVGRASVPVYRSHPGIRRRRISGIQTKTVLSALGPQSSLLPTASCISLCLKLPTESVTSSLSRISRLGPFSPNFTSNPACAISRFQNPEIRGQTTEDRKKLLNRRQTRTNTDRHSPADFLFFGTRVPHGGTHGYSRIKDGSAKNAKITKATRKRIA